jgi:hypothetical protein
VTDHSREMPCSAQVLLCWSFSDINGKNGLRISAFKKLLNRVCLYIAVIIEGMLERKLYPSNCSSYQVLKCMYPNVVFLSHLFNNISIVHP